MSHDSDDWDDLSLDYIRRHHTAAAAPSKCLTSPPPSSPQPTAATTGGANSHRSLQALSCAVLRPLCLCVNQRHTRVGVGHETGFLVFKVTPRDPSLSSTRQENGEEAEAQSIGSQLVLEPSYNTDEESFSAIQKRMKARANPFKGATPPPAQRAAGSSSDTTDGAYQMEDGLDLFLSYANLSLSQLGLFESSTAHSRKAAESAASSSPLKTLAWDEEDDDDNRSPCTENKTGFSLGGVGVMALLYEQPTTAVVGGGPTPIGPPNNIHLLNRGQRIQCIAMKDPVTKLVLDGRLLFILTTHTFAIYTNPMESEWTACAYRYSLDSPTVIVSQSPAAVFSNFMSPWSGNSSAAPTWSIADASRVTGSAASIGKAPGDDLNDTKRPLPPCAIDYARSLVLLPAPQAPCGFILLHYSYAYEMVGVPFANALSNDHLHGSIREDKDGSGAGSNSEGTLRRPVVHGAVPAQLRIEEIARCAEAHKNPLTGLALHVGPTPPGLSPAGNGDLTGEVLSGNMHHRSSSRLDPLRETILVAACSEYATRISLWLVPSGGGVVLPTAGEEEEGESSTTQAAERQRIQTTGASGKPLSRRCSSAYTAATPVPLREFRTGIRIPGRAHRFLRGLASSGGGVGAEDAATIHHLQFLHGGRFLFCVHDGVMKVYATVEESSFEAKNVCHDHPQAAQNTHSRLTTVSKYVPKQLNLEAYTRQAWASCQAPLPVHDRNFYPAWLLVVKQDEMAHIRMAATTAPERRSTNWLSMPKEHASSSGTSPKWVGGWVGAVVKATTAWVAPSALPTPPTTSAVSHTPHARVVESEPLCVSVWSAGSSAEAVPVSPFPRALRLLAPCLLFWEGHPTDNCRSGCDSHIVFSSHLMASQLVLNCVTCDGSAMTVRLRTDEGQLQCDPAVPYVLPRSLC